MSIIRFNRKNQMSQVFNIYWQAWGYEQAQLQKQLYIKKTSNKLNRIIQSMYINALSKMIFNFPTPELRNEDLKRLLSIPKDIESFMKDLELLSQLCLQGRLPNFWQEGAHRHYNKYNRCRSRIFRLKPFTMPKGTTTDSIFRVDAIVCLF